MHVVTLFRLVQMQHEQMQYAAHLAGMQMAGNPLCMWVPSKAMQSPTGATPSLFSQHSAHTGRGGISSMSIRETDTNGLQGGNNSSDSGPSIHERGARHVYISRMIERAAASNPTAMKNHEGTGSGGEEATAENCTTKTMEGSGGAKSSAGDGDGGSGNDDSKALQMECTAGGSHISGRAGCSPSDDECTESARGGEGNRCDSAAARSESAQQHAMARRTDATPPTADGNAAVQGGSQGPRVLPCMIAGSGGALKAGAVSGTAVQWGAQAHAANGQGAAMMGQSCLPAGAMFRGMPVGLPGGVVAGGPPISGAMGPGFTIAALQQASACNTNQQSNATSFAAMTAQRDGRASVSGQLDGEKVHEASAKQSGGASPIPSAVPVVIAPSASQGATCAPARAPSAQKPGGKQSSGEAAGASGSPVSATAPNFLQSQSAVTKAALSPEV